MQPSSHRHPGLPWKTLVLGLLVALALPLTVRAQPFGAWSIFDGDPANYYQIPHSPALNPTGAITIEGWVNVSSTGGCRDLIGKGYASAWWVGICGNTLRSYLRGNTSGRDAGVIGQTGWHHFAVTYNGAQRCHYIDGEIAGCWAEAAPLTTNTQPVRIGSDVDYSGFPTDGTINEIRLWNVARTTAQIRSTINVPITAPQPGLVAVWANGGPLDVVGVHDGVLHGTVPKLTFPVTALPCSSTTNFLCVRDRFVVTTKWRTTTSSGNGTVAPLATFQSGIFWFFNVTNWEVMVKVLDGCSINNRYWVFSAATTNVFYRMEVLDQLAGVNKVYFNYPGPPAPAVTDTGALATCP